MQKNHSTQITNQSRYREFAKKNKIMSNDFGASNYHFGFQRPSADKLRKSPLKSEIVCNMKKSDYLSNESYQNPFYPISSKENHSSISKKMIRPGEKSPLLNSKIKTISLFRSEITKKQESSRTQKNIPDDKPTKIEPIPSPPIPTNKLEVQTTASFNLYSSDIFKDTQLEVTETFSKLEKVFDTGAKCFNKSQTAFALKSVGIVERLNDEFNGETHEEDLLINIVYSCLKNESGKVQPEALRHFLYLMKVLLRNNVLVLASKLHRDSSEMKMSSQETVKLKTDKKEGKSFDAKGEVNEIMKERKEFSVGKVKRKTSSCLKEGDRLQFSVEGDDQFSFKKSMDWCRAEKAIRQSRIKDFMLPGQMNEANEVVTNRNLTKEFENFSEIKTDSDKSVEIKNKINGLRISAKEDLNHLCSSDEVPHLKSSKGSDGDSSQLSPDFILERNRGKFLFSTYIRQGNQNHSLMVYEKDDVQELAKAFCEKHKFNFEASKNIFEKIEWQKSNFTKNFVVEINSEF